uniref:PRO1292 n=1 Tax=Homo sapiens TaxID=9606 RepID=Q9H3B6_HUMAN|nr:PRO1292 [Homo sapiens]
MSDFPVHSKYFLISSLQVLKMHKKDFTSQVLLRIYFDLICMLVKLHVL